MLIFDKKQERIGIRAFGFDIDIDVDMSLKEIPRYAICGGIFWASIIAIYLSVGGYLGIFGGVALIAAIMGLVFSMSKYFEYPDRNPGILYSEARNRVVRLLYQRGKISGEEFASSAGIPGAHTQKANLLLDGAGIVLGVHPGHLRANDVIKELFVISPESLPTIDEKYLKHSQPLSPVEVYWKEVQKEFSKIIEYSGGNAICLDSLKNSTFGEAVKACAVAMGNDTASVEAHLNEARKTVTLV